MSEGKTFTWLGAVVIIGWAAIAALVILLWGCTAAPKRERVIYRLTVNGKLVEERIEEATVEPIDPNRKDKPCE